MTINWETKHRKNIFHSFSLQVQTHKRTVICHTFFLLSPLQVCNMIRVSFSPLRVPMVLKTGPGREPERGVVPVLVVRPVVEPVTS